MVKTKRKYDLFTGRALFLLIFPIVVESALSMSLGMIDGLMASYAKEGVGDAILTAITSVDQISSLIIQLFVAFGVGGAVVCAQLIGAGRIEDANRSAKQLVVIALLVALFFTGICLALNHQIINLLFSDISERTKKYAYTYFYINCASYPFLGLFNACAALLRAQRKSLNTMISGIISFFLNIGFNALFIYAFKLEIAGVALGTLLARIFPAAFTLFLLTRKGNLVKIKIFERFRFDGKLLKKILRLAVPSGIENSLFQLGKIAVIAFISISIYSDATTSANSVAYNINTVSSIVGNGINTSILTVIGQAVGTGDLNQVKYYVRKMFAISYIGNTLCVALVFALSPLLLDFYNVSPEARQIAWKCLLLCLPVQFVTYPLSFGMPAVLKASSDVKYVMGSAIFSMLTMRVGLCYILTCEWAGAHLGAFGLWIGMVADWGLRGILFLARYLTGNWKKSSGLIKDYPDYGESEIIAKEQVAKIFKT